MTTTTPLPPTTPQATSGKELVEAIRELHPLLARNAVESEISRQLTPETVDALRQVGVLRMATPRRYGGLELTLTEQVEALAALAEADGSTSWVAVLWAVGSWGMGRDTAANQAEVFGADPDARYCGLLQPVGRATPVEGGWRLSGRGYFATGCGHSTWIGVNSYLLDDNGEVADTGFLRVPMEDVTIEDTWNVVGMRGTGSHCAVLDDVFVPKHRLLSFSESLAGNTPTPFKDEALYRAPFSSYMLTIMVAPQIGLGKAALDYVTAKSKKPIAYTNFEVQSDSTGFQIQVARAATLVETARLNALRAAELIDGWCASGYAPSEVERARIRGHVSATIESTNQALNILLFAHGAGSFAEANPLQKIWRDSNAVARHGLTLPEINYETYGKALLGADDHVTPLI